MDPETIEVYKALLQVCARPSAPWRDDCRRDRDGALGVLDDELEAQVARSF